MYSEYNAEVRPIHSLHCNCALQRGAMMHCRTIGSVSIALRVAGTVIKRKGLQCERDNHPCGGGGCRLCKLQIAILCTQV